MRRVEFYEDIKKAEFIYALEFALAKHNYLCAVCKRESAVMELCTGILQPCWECQKSYKVKKLSWFDRLISRNK
jgi:ribosomal protein L37AE/L43A